MMTAQTIRIPDSGRSATRPYGLSLVELMIALVISSILLAGVISIFVSTRQSQQYNTAMARMQENARYIFDRLSTDIAAAGFLGCLDTSSSNAVRSDLSDTSNAYDFSLPVTGSDATGLNNTDILRVKRATTSFGIPLTATASGTAALQLDDSNSEYSDLQQWDILAVGDCGNATTLLITNDPSGSSGSIEHKAGIAATSGLNAGISNVTGDLLIGSYGSSRGTPARAFRLVSRTYLVGTSVAGSGMSIYRDSVTANNELIDGVSDFQILYGENTDGNDGADRYVSANNVSDWNDVVAVRISLSLSTTLPDGNTISRDFEKTVQLRNRL